MRSRLALTTLIATLAVVLLVVVVHASFHSYTFTKSIIVNTETLTFTATGSLDVAVPPGAYGKINVTVVLTNPGTSDASATVSESCFGSSVTVTVPAGGSASAVLTLNIPSPLTTYMTCTISASVPNITGVSLAFTYDADISMVYNETVVNYTVPLFTIPYIVIGGSNMYFHIYTITLTRSASTFGNATITATFSDSYVKLVTASAGSSGFTVQINDTYPYVGRGLGTVTLTVKPNEEAVSLAVLPITVNVTGSDVPNILALPSDKAVHVLQGEEVRIAISNPLTVISSTGTSYNVTYIKIIRYDALRLPTGTKTASGSVMLGGYNFTYLARGIPENNTVVTLLALIELPDKWVEPVYRKLDIVTRLLNVTVKFNVEDKVTSLGTKVKFTVPSAVKTVATYRDNFTVLAKLVSLSEVKSDLYVTSELPDASGYLVVRISAEDKPIFDYVYAVAYVGVGTRSSVSRYMYKIVDVQAIPTASIVTSLSGVVPVATITLKDSYRKLTSHLEALAPVDDSSSIYFTYSIVAPIRVSVTPTFKTSAISTAYLILIVDDKPYSKKPRSIVLPTGISEVKTTPHVRVVSIGVDYNATPILVDLTADIKLTFYYNDGKTPARGIRVELWRGSTLVARLETDRRGVALLDPTYGYYTVKYYYDGQVESIDLSLADDFAKTITLPIPPPKVKVTDIVVSGPSEVAVNEPFSVTVTVYLNMAPDSPFTVSGWVYAVSPSGKVIRYPFTVTIPAGKVQGSTVVSNIKLSEAGTWSIYAEAMGVKSSNILQIKVTTRPAAVQIGGISLSLTDLLIIVLIIVVIVVAAVLISEARRRRITHL